MKKIFAWVYALIGYIGFLGSFLYLIGFLGNFAVPKTVNTGIEGSVGSAVLVNMLLVVLFGAHHSIAAGPHFKKWITQHIPKYLERSTYVILADIFFILLLWQWRPMATVIWQIDTPAIQAIIYIFFSLGFLLVVLASFLINHFDLLGLRQVWLYSQGKEYTHVPFKLSFLYKLVRHPIMLGWFMAFWFTPFMTTGHLLFATLMTAYGIIGMIHEEQNLMKHLGDEYKAYREDTPFIIPFLRTKK